MSLVLDNGSIAELFVREAEGASGHREMAFLKAANEAFMWLEEAEDVAASGRSLRELPGIGPTLARQVYRWLEDPPKAEPPELRREFLTLAQAKRVLARSRRGGRF